MNERAIAYIDGYNLYYGMLKGSLYKWLDLKRFVRSLIRPEFEVVAVKYFTATIKTHPYDPPAVDRQKIYLQAIKAFGGVEVVYGFYSKRRALAPLSNPKCAPCDVSKAGLVPIQKLEEKRSDVNLAAALVSDAALGKADCFVVVTGDADQVGAIETVRHVFKKTVVVFNPHEAESHHLKSVASYYHNIPRDLPAKCQLPDVVPYGSRGDRFIHRPPAWA